MTPGRKEPTFSSNLGADIPEDPRRSNASMGATAPETASYHSESVGQTRVAHNSSSGGSGWMGILLGLAALGLAGFLFWQWTLTQQLLQDSEARILQLEKQLTLSGDEASQSVTALQANLKQSNESLKLAHSELRKLWDTRNVNKRAISDNQSDLASVKKNVESIKASLQKDIDSTQGLVDGFSKSMKSLKTQITGVAALQDEQNVRLDALDAIEREIESLKKQIDRLKSTANQLDTLSKQVNEQDEVLKSVDAYRVSTNRQILDLKNRLGGVP